MSWTEATDRPGYRVKTLQRGSCTIEIYRPNLSQAEQAKREHHIKEVMGHTLHDYLLRGGETHA